jgi:hypothetical protein
MISEDGRDLIADAVEQRRIKLEREPLNAPYECRAESPRTLSAAEACSCSLSRAPAGLPPALRSIEEDAQ